MHASSHQIRCNLAAAAACSLLAAPVWAEAATPPDGLAPASLHSSVSLPGDYRIGPDDTLDVDVFQVRDLSGSVQVDAQGQILLPLIGEISAAGLTPNQLSQKIATQLGDKYLKNPQVRVTVKDSTSQKITIDGAVLRPGVYPLNGPTTLLQAVSLASGPDPKLSDTNRVSIIRAVDGRRMASTYNLESIRAGKQPDPPIYPKDVVVVATSGGKSFMQNWGSVLPLLALLRP